MNDLYAYLVAPLPDKLFATINYKRLPGGRVVHPETSGDSCLRNALDQGWYADCDQKDLKLITIQQVKGNTHVYYGVPLGCTVLQQEFYKGEDQPTMSMVIDLDIDMLGPEYLRVLHWMRDHKRY